MASGDTLLTALPQNNEPPVANFGTLDTRNGTSPHPILDLALSEIGIFSFVMPRHYAGTTGITIYLHYAMASANSDDIKLQTELEKIGDGGDLNTDGWAATQNTGDITVPGATDQVDIVTTVHTDGAQMDTIIVGDLFRLRVTRIAVAGVDASGDLELRAIEIKET